MYPYPAGGTGLSITVPNWVFEEGEDSGVGAPPGAGGPRAAQARGRGRLEPGWSNLVQASGGWDHVVLANPFNPKYDPTG